MVAKPQENQIPPIRRAALARPLTPPPKRPRIRAPFALLFLVASALLWWQFSPWKGFAIPGMTPPQPPPRAAPAEPKPDLRFVAEIETAVAEGNLRTARDFLAQRTALQVPTAEQETLVQTLEAKRKNEIATAFQAAEQANDLAGMREQHADFLSLWPDEALGTAWAEKVDAREKAEADKIRRAELAEQFQKHMKSQQFMAADQALDAMAKLGADVTGRRSLLVRVIQLPGGVPLRMRWIPAGSFQMGSPPEEEGRMADEVLHEVVLTKGFWLGETEITQAQWEAVMGMNTAYNKGPTLPVEMVSVREIEVFLDRLNKDQKGLFRLPTEAEWEYACRSKTSTAYHAGQSLTTQANFDGSQSPTGVYRKKTIAVKSFPPNAWGLYDMHGNVWEWCSDHYGPYDKGPVVDPVAGMNFRGVKFVVRGGGWGDYPDSCRSARRYSHPPRAKSQNLGFRLVRGE